MRREGDNVNMRGARAATEMIEACLDRPVSAARAAADAGHKGPALRGVSGNRFNGREMCCGGLAERATGNGRFAPRRAKAARLLLRNKCHYVYPLGVGAQRRALLGMTGLMARNGRAEGLVTCTRTEMLPRAGGAVGGR